MTYSTPAEKTRAAHRVTLIGMILDIALGLLKIIVGVIAQSHALVADGIHSFTDAGTDILVIVITRYSHQKPDREHPYGHGKFETLGTVVLGSMLIAVAGAMAYDSILRLWEQDAQVAPGWPALLAAALSIAGKEWIYRYTLDIGKKLRSDLIIANAWHSRSDALSSVVVLVALLGVIAGFPWLDAVAAIIVAILVGKIGIELAGKSVKELVETALPEEQVRALRELALSVEGVRGVHDLRGRYVGPDIVIDLHLQVDSALSVSEGHYIGVHVARKIQEKFEHISDITYHIDTENDTDGKKRAGSPLLPLRQDVTEILRQRWRDLTPEDSIKRLILHYINGQVHVEVMITENEDHLSREIVKSMRESTADLAWLGEIKVWREAP
ncbi:cation diffusion facilitator family transporter [Hahella sp. KA22]|uniref:cation diffusion facilitator family transporter n=1 Tax=Hahella sp. KA22 TaxID=1628392 RepID=UPI000FDE7BF7|nr:cation diffusion facilitator family transporter [Hahella sp. KA22]AZZ91154.1 cation transporter [Hahella sp. KA22]QAY54522.1 cation diffusion facilitator family transporter [Hahella sp. KA22]